LKDVPGSKDAEHGVDLVRSDVPADHKVDLQVLLLLVQLAADQA
jgi:hypothetical protein